MATQDWSAADGPQAKAAAYLHTLCRELPGRPVGSACNRMATGFFAGVADSFGFAVEAAGFDCLDWRADGANCTVDGESYGAFVSPNSPGCQVTAPLVVAGTVAELEAAAATVRVLFLQGEMAGEQLMPKSFPFYNPDHHQRIIRLLEALQPAAIIAATTQDAAMAGSSYPFPLIEDGDFDIASVYMTAEEGARPAGRAPGSVVTFGPAASVIAAAARRCCRRVTGG